MTELGPEDYVASIRADGLALVAAADGHLKEQVPSCPGWDMAELVWHTGGVHRFWNEIAGRQLLDPDDVEEVERPADADLLAWYGEGLADLLTTLATADPEEPVWSWASADPVPTSWIHRRMAQETAVHRWDAQDSISASEPVAADLAADGIDEFLQWFAGFDPDHLAGGGETIGLVATDTGRAWVARVADGELDVRPPERASAFGPVEATATGTASDLLLLLWRRRRPDEVEVSGDPAALARFLRRAGLD